MDILQKIAKQRQIRVDELKSKNMPLQRVGRDPILFFKREGGFTLISECKKGSPSKGIFNQDYSVAKLAKEYSRGGTDGISVLTEPDFFYGSNDDLQAVRVATEKPILRKDFIIDAWQIKESWAIGADAILLIVALLDLDKISRFYKEAKSYGLDVLTEVHDRQECELALQAGVDVIGINCRNLKDFSVDLEAAADLVDFIPDDLIAIAESGIKTSEEAANLYKRGFRGFLIGETFVTAPSKIDAVAEFKRVLLEQEVG